MKLTSKVGVSILVLLLFATPIVACALPAMAMTKAEHECCKRMAQDCGKSGMAQSHSCCQTAAAPDRSAAIKSSSDVNLQHLPLVLLANLPPVSAAMATEFGSPWWASDIHSPPVSPPVSISVLRI